MVIIVAFLAINFIVAGCFVLGTRGVEVVITNDGSRSINNLAIRFTGGTESVAELAPRTTHKVRINPNGESHLEIEFLDSQGVSHREILDVYLEQNYQGRITVWIDSSGKVTWKSEVKI